MAEEVISTASIVYKYHQRYGNAKDKTRKGNMHKYKTKKNKQLQQQNNNNKKETKKTCRVHTNAQNAVFHLNPAITQRTSADVQNRFEHDAILKIIFEHFLIQHAKNMQICLFNTDSFRTSVYEKNIESKNREKKILFCLKPLFLLRCSFGDV